MLNDGVLSLQCGHVGRCQKKDLRRRGASPAWQNLISHCQDGAKLQVAAVIFSLREKESERERERGREREIERERKRERDLE